MDYEELKKLQLAYIQYLLKLLDRELGKYKLGAKGVEFMLGKENPFRIFDIKIKNIHLAEKETEKSWQLDGHTEMEIMTLPNKVSPPKDKESSELIDLIKKKKDV